MRRKVLSALGFVVTRESLQRLRDNLLDHFLRVVEFVGHEPNVDHLVGNDPLVIIERTAFLGSDAKSNPPLPVMESRCIWSRLLLTKAAMLLGEGP